MNQARVALMIAVARFNTGIYTKAAQVNRLINVSKKMIERTIAINSKLIGLLNCNKL